MIPLAIVGALVCAAVLVLVLVGSALSQGDVDATPRPPLEDHLPRTGAGDWR